MIPFFSGPGLQNGRGASVFAKTERESLGNFSNGWRGPLLWDGANVFHWVTLGQARRHSQCAGTPGGAGPGVTLI